MSKSYELWVHWKQGDDLHSLLENHPDNLPEALRSWATCFKNSAAVCERLAKAFEGQNINVLADTHLIQFTPADDAAVRCLETMVAEELISVVEYEDDEYEDDEYEDDEVD